MAAKTRFQNADGTLTGYALACGYQETRKLRGYENADVTLWREHECLHVRAHDFITHKRLFWETPETIREARKLFRNAEREAQAQAQADHASAQTEKA